MKRLLIIGIAALLLGCNAPEANDRRTAVPSVQAKAIPEDVLRSIEDAYRAKEYDKVTELCQRATNDFPSAVAPYFYLGAVHIVFLELEEAEKAFDTVQRLDPGNTNVVPWLDLVESGKELEPQSQ
jgi:cytochrome c-type biogenesis protein CcmH/NrfG